MHRAIKEITRPKSIEPPQEFDFELVAEETNAQTLKRVKKFIQNNTAHCDHLEDGSIYFGEKEGITPNGTGFVAVFSEDSNTMEQCYLGNFNMGKASSYGFLIFDRGTGRYSGMWEEGKYHGNGLFKREIASEPNGTKTQIYDGQWQLGDMSGFGVF